MEIKFTDYGQMRDVNATDEEIRRTFNYATSNGNDIPYEEFHAIMAQNFGNIEN